MKGNTHMTKKILPKKMITAVLVGGALLLGAGTANATTSTQENAIESAESYLELLRVLSPGADRTAKNKQRCGHRASIGKTDH